MNFQYVDQQAEKLSVLANPLRLKIMYILFKMCIAQSAEVAHAIGEPREAVSKEIDALVEAEILEAHQQFPDIVEYAIRDKHLYGSLTGMSVTISI